MKTAPRFRLRLPGILLAAFLLGSAAAGKDAAALPGKTAEPASAEDSATSAPEELVPLTSPDEAGIPEDAAGDAVEESAENATPAKETAKPEEAEESEPEEETAEEETAPEEAEEAKPEEEAAEETEEEAKSEEAEPEEETDEEADEDKEPERVEIPFSCEWTDPEATDVRDESLGSLLKAIAGLDGLDSVSTLIDSDGTRADFTVSFKTNAAIAFPEAVRELYEALDRVPLPAGASLKMPYLVEGAEPSPRAGDDPAAESGDDGAAEPAAPAAALPPRPEAPAIPWRTATYSLVARAMDLRQVFETFGVAQGIPTLLSANVAGTISGEFSDVPCDEFLDRLAALHNLSWYWDGATLWINSTGEMQTILLDLRYMKAGEVRAMLAELGVEDPRFPLKTASEDELIMVSGPPRYVSLVAEMIQKADALREKRTFTELETRIFPLENTWAADISFSAGSPESGGEIQGVASMLREIVGKIVTPDSREAGSTNAPTSFKPLITAENRLNAVVVTDVGPRMSLYERLIKELDVPQKLVEIQITVVEMSRKDALDWQLSIAGTGKRDDRISGGVGQNAGNLFDAEGLGGRGLAGALTYLGSKSTVSASLTALRDKGKARNISRTSVLTVNNLAAALSDQQSYHARVIGAEVAELAEVSAGTTLKVKPRLMHRTDTNAPSRVWLTLSLVDGGFETVSVDSMPMTRSSSLETQASVYEDDTIVLAGYLRDIEESAGWGIPWLRDLPLLGWLFGGHSSKTETVQRLFLISPHVIDPDAEDLARIQAMRLRDIEEMEELDEDAQDMDEERELRDLDRQERRERRQDALDERLARRKAEIQRAREERARLRKEREAMDETQNRGGCLPW